MPNNEKEVVNEVDEDLDDLLFGGGDEKEEIPGEKILEPVKDILTEHIEACKNSPRVTEVRKTIAKKTTKKKSDKKKTKKAVKKTKAKTTPKPTAEPTPEPTEPPKDEFIDEVLAPTDPSKVRTADGGTLTHEPGGKTRRGRQFMRLFP